MPALTAGWVGEVIASSDVPGTIVVAGGKEVGNDGVIVII